MTIKTKLTLFSFILCHALVGMAEEPEKHVWKPEVGMELTTELQATHTGDYNWANLLRLGASLPMHRGLSLEIGTLSACMTADESIGGDLQTFSNLDAPRIPLALSMLNLAWEHGGHTLYAGVRNMNEDYFCSPVTSLFTGSSCGIFPTISANYDVANYPMASVGVHYRYRPTPNPSHKGRGVDTQTSDSRPEGKASSPLPPWEGLGVGLSLYNGRGYNRFGRRENVFRFCPKSDGVFGLAEVAYNHSGSSYFVGTAVHSSPSASGSGQQVSITPWAYAEQRITDRLSLIAGYSHAFGSDAACRDFAGIGGRYTWERAELGLFSDYARFTEGDEFATELTCKITLTPHLYLQPSLHATFMPDDAALFHGAGTLRLGVTF